MIDTLIRRIYIAGCAVDVLTVAETLALIEAFIAERIPCRHGFVNAVKVTMMQSDSEFLQTCNTCDVINADGMAVVWASRILGTPLPERVNGTNLMMDLIRLSHKKGYRIYLLGARRPVIERSVHILEERFPGLQIVGWRDGYFNLEEEEDIARNIRDARPDILFVGMPTPRKEYWLYRNVPLIDVPFCMEVGGSFDVVAGIVKRAPVLAQNMGMEWFYRFIQEPRRLWRRYLIGNLHFIWIIFREKLKLIFEMPSNESLK